MQFEKDFLPQRNHKKFLANFPGITGKMESAAKKPQKKQNKKKKPIKKHPGYTASSQGNAWVTHTSYQEIQGRGQKLQPDRKDAS